MTYTLIGSLLLNAWDWAEIAVFFLLLVGIAGLCSRKAGRDAKDFFLSGRSMPWWLIGVSMCAASTSTNSANMFTDFIRNSGLSENWKRWAFLRGFRSLYLGIVFNVITTGRLHELIQKGFAL